MLIGDLAIEKSLEISTIITLRNLRKFPLVHIDGVSEVGAKTPRAQGTLKAVFSLRSS